MSLATLQIILNQLAANDPSPLVLRVVRLEAANVDRLCQGLRDTKRVLKSFKLLHGRLGMLANKIVSALAENPHCTEIESLLIFDENLGLEGAKFLASALPSFPKVIDFRIGLNHIGFEGFEGLLSPPFPRCQTLLCQPSVHA